MISKESLYPFAFTPCTPPLAVCTDSPLLAVSCRCSRAARGFLTGVPISVVRGLRRRLGSVSALMTARCTDTRGDVRAQSLQSCLALCDLMTCSPPGS